MRRFHTTLLLLATATLAVGCGSEGHRDRPRSAPDSGHPNLLTRADVLPEGHPPVDPHHPWLLLPQGHPPVREDLPACPRGRMAPGEPRHSGGEASRDVPGTISI